MREQIIFLDMDCVMVDFLSGALAALNEKYDRSVTVREYVEFGTGWNINEYYGITEEEFYMALTVVDNFWVNLDPMPWSFTLHKELSKLGQVLFCTTPSPDPDSLKQKARWLIGYGYSSSCLITTTYKHLMAGHGVLIDDSPENCKMFEGHGGEALLVRSNWNTLDLTFDNVFYEDILGRNIL